MSLSNEWRGYGYLGCDPEIYKTSIGSIIVRCSMATTDKCIDLKTGLIFENIQWHKLIAYGKTAENVAKTFKKGREVLITASLQTYKHRTELRIISFSILKWTKNKDQNNETAENNAVELPKKEKTLRNITDREFVDVEEYYKNEFLDV